MKTTLSQDNYDFVLYKNLSVIVLLRETDIIFLNVLFNYRK